jgi:Cu/Ag efflux protein CusF
MAAVAAPAAGSLQAATAKPSSEREVRIVGTIAKLTAVKLKVANASRTVAFVIPAGFNLGGVQKGDRVEAEGRKVGGKLTLTSVHREDRAAAVSYSAARHGADDHGHHGGHGGDDGPGHH